MVIMDYHVLCFSKQRCFQICSCFMSLAIKTITISIRQPDGDQDTTQIFLCYTAILCMSKSQLNSKQGSKQNLHLLSFNFMFRDAQHHLLFKISHLQKKRVLFDALSRSLH